MKRVIKSAAILLLLNCLFLSAECAEPIRTRILIGTREAIVAPAPVFDGQRVLAPIAILNSLRVNYIAAPDGTNVTLLTEEGESEIKTVDVDGTLMLPVDEVVEVIGADAQYDSASSILILTARLQSVEFADNTLKINCSLPVSYSSHIWQNKLVVDIPNTRLATEAKEVYIGTPLVQRARLGAPTPRAARVVLDLRKPVGWKFESEPVASQIVVSVGEGLPVPVTVKPQTVTKGSGKPFIATGIQINTIDDSAFELLVTTNTKGTAAADYGVMPPSVVLHLKGGVLAGNLVVPEVTNPLIRQIRADGQSQYGSRVVLDLARVVAYGVSVDDSSIRLHVRAPVNAGGSLAGKLIVIDPGHGSRSAPGKPIDKGAHYGKLLEKDLNVRIANEVAAALEREGARTILTRTGDVNRVMTLAARSETAINNNADFFISIHCNSNGSRNSASGIETYYHMYEPDPMALAYAINAGVCLNTGMCDLGPRSDRTLWTRGLAVLRRLENTGIPGALVECGYLNHSADRGKLVDSNYRKKVAAGIVAGLKAYVEGVPIKMTEAHE